VDFGQERHIELVRINNRVVGHFDTLGRLETSTIRVGNTDTYDANAVCAKINGSHDIYSVACNSIGRYLFVVIGTTGSHACLHFTELEAYGACTQCIAGKYKAASGIACENCPANSGSPAGGIACTCNAGFTDIHGGVCNREREVTSHASAVVVVVVVGVVVCLVVLVCHVRCRVSSKTVSPEIQEGGDSAGGEAVFEQHNQPCTLASNTGWVGGECNPLAILSAPLSVGESECLQQHTSSTLLKEEVNLFQKASIKRARLQNTEDSQSLDQLKKKLDRIKTTGQAEEKHKTVKEDRICQLEKEICEFKEVSQEAARRKKTEDDARFLELELLLTAVLEDEVAATTKRKEDYISNSKEKDLVVSHSQPRQGSQCVICLHAEAVMALMPCRHLCVCESPACMLQQCPMCRAPVVEVRRIYSFDR
jgi:hypothetical protein